MSTLSRGSLSVCLLALSAALAFAWSEEDSPARPTTDANPVAETKSTDAESAQPADEPQREILSGKVVLLAEALKARKIKSYPEEIKGQVVLATSTGELVPIVSDWRGRAFYQDERLRDRPVDLIVNRHRGVPWVQVLSIYMLDEKGVHSIFDYWCDVCSIPMYEIKDCECCQGPIRLRLRPQELPKDLQKP